MKKTFTIIALTVLVWGCTKKMSPVVSGSTISSNSGTSGSAPITPALKLENVPVPVANSVPVVPVSPNTPGSMPVDPAKLKSPEVLGQSTFNAKCGRCHGLKVTSDYTAERWVSIMQVMAQKAQLTDTEKENVLAYVKVNAKR
jgi:hypothetical protein